MASYKQFLRRTFQGLRGALPGVPSRVWTILTAVFTRHCTAVFQRVDSGSSITSWFCHGLALWFRYLFYLFMSVSLLVRWGRYWISTGAKSLRTEWQLMKESDCCSHAAATVIAYGGGQAAGPQGVKQTQRFHSQARTQEA